MGNRLNQYTGNGFQGRHTDNREKRKTKTGNSIDTFECIIHSLVLFVANKCFSKRRKKQWSLLNLLFQETKYKGRVESGSWISKKSSWMCKCACRAQIADPPSQPPVSIMHFDTVAHEVVNELLSLSRMFDHEEAVTAVPTLIHKNGLEEIKESVSSLLQNFLKHSSSTTTCRAKKQKEHPVEITQGESLSPSPMTEMYSQSFEQNISLGYINGT